MLLAIASGKTISEAATRCILQDVFYVFFLKIFQYSQKNETPTKVFSCECCEIFKKTYFEEHLRAAASVTSKIIFAVRKYRVEALQF